MIALSTIDVSIPLRTAGSPRAARPENDFPALLALLDLNSAADGIASEPPAVSVAVQNLPADRLETSLSDHKDPRQALPRSGLTVGPASVLEAALKATPLPTPSMVSSLANVQVRPIRNKESLRSASGGARSAQNHPDDRAQFSRTTENPIPASVFPGRDLSSDALAALTTATATGGTGSNVRQPGPGVRHELDDRVDGIIQRHPLGNGPWAPTQALGREGALPLRAMAIPVDRDSSSDPDSTVSRSGVFSATATQANCGSGASPNPDSHGPTLAAPSVTATRADSNVSAISDGNGPRSAAPFVTAPRTDQDSNAPANPDRNGPRPAAFSVTAPRTDQVSDVSAISDSNVPRSAAPSLTATRTEQVSNAFANPASATAPQTNRGSSAFADPSGDHSTPVAFRSELHGENNVAESQRPAADPLPAPASGPDWPLPFAAPQAPADLTVTPPNDTPFVSEAALDQQHRTSFIANAVVGTPQASNLTPPTIGSADSERRGASPTTSARRMVIDSTSAKPSLGAPASADRPRAAHRAPEQNTPESVNPEAPQVLGNPTPKEAAPVSARDFGAPDSISHASTMDPGNEPRPDLAPEHGHRDLPSTAHIVQEPEMAEPLPGSAGLLNSSRLMDRVNQSELRVGVHSADFGEINISTRMNSEGMTAEISVQHAALRDAISADLPSLTEHLHMQQVTMEGVVVVPQTTGASAGFGQTAHQQQRQAYADAPSAQSSLAAREIEPREESSAAASAVGLDIRI